MKPDFNTIVAKAKSVSMSEAESSVIRRHLEELSSKPVTFNPLSRPIVRSPYVSAHYSFIRIAMPALLITALILTGGTAAAAEMALPGDLLYPVKVHVTEEARTALTFNSEAKVAWEGERVVRRLEEATTLASEGRLTSQAQAVIAANIETHTEEVEKEATSLEASGKLAIAAEVASNIESSIRAHKTILAKLTAPTSPAVMLLAEPEVSVQARGIGRVEDSISSATFGSAEAGESEPDLPLTATLNAKLQKVVDIRLKSESRMASSTDPRASEEAAKSQQKVATKKLENVTLLLAESEATIEADIKAKVEAHLGKAASYMLEAENELAAGNFSQAFKLFSSALHIGQEANVLLKHGTIKRPEREADDAATTTSRAETEVQIGKPLIPTLPVIPQPVEIEGPTTIRTETNNTTSSSDASSSGNIRVNLGL